MTTRSDSIRGSRAFQYIKEKKRAHKFELMTFLGLSISSYEKFKPWFEYSYGVPSEYGCIHYEKESKEWVFCHNEEPETQIVEGTTSTV